MKPHYQSSLEFESKGLNHIPQEKKDTSESCLSEEVLFLFSLLKRLHRIVRKSSICFEGN